jgi:hypothetical protein
LVEATAPFPGDEAMLGGTMRLMGRGSLPLDHWLAPFSVGVTGLVIVLLGINAFAQKRRRKVPMTDHQTETKGAL